MNAAGIEMAKREAEIARRRLDSTIAGLQQRLHPKSLANEAWEGVRDKSSDLADNAVDIVKERPAAASMALGALVLFMARGPLKRGVSRLFSQEEEDDGRITTQIEKQEANFHVGAPFVEAPVNQGVIS
jgi:hypothetical protein